MAANWVLLPLLFSLCLATSYGKRVGVSAMDDRVENYMSQSLSSTMQDSDPDFPQSRSAAAHKHDHSLSAPFNPNPPVVGIPGSCGGSGSCGGNCGYGCDSCGLPYGIGYGLVGLNSLKETIRDLTMKLEANGLLGQHKEINMQTMTP